MPIDRAGLILARIGLLLCLCVPGLAPAGEASPAQAQAQRQVTQPLNNAPFWREVRKGEDNPYQTTQVRGPETHVLIQSEGETWRQFRNGPITLYGGWFLVIVFLAILLFYWRRGEIMLHEPKTGRLIERFTPWERIVHWTVAITFVILAVTGIIMLFGKHVVLPVIGYTLFSWLGILGKNLHNFLGPLFVVSLIIMAITYLRDNIPHARDWTYVRRFGDFLRGQSVPAGRFNAMEKFWFWAGVILLGVLVSATGLVMDFPNFGQTREAMQIVNVIHAIAAVLFMALALGHIYIGTIGMEGAYDAMRHGSVDETWAREHHLYWYEDVMRGEARRSAGHGPATAPAAPIKEGWKA